MSLQSAQPALLAALLLSSNSQDAENWPCSGFTRPQLSAGPLNRWFLGRLIVTATDIEPRQPERAMKNDDEAETPILGKQTGNRASSAGGTSFKRSTQLSDQLPIRILYDEHTAKSHHRRDPSASWSQPSPRHPVEHADYSTHGLAQQMRVTPASDFQNFVVGHNSSEEHVSSHGLKQQSRATPSSIHTADHSLSRLAFYLQVPLFQVVTKWVNPAPLEIPPPKNANHGSLTQMRSTTAHLVMRMFFCQRP